MIGSHMHAQIAIRPADLEVDKWRGDILVVGVFEGSLGKFEEGGFQNPVLKNLDELFGGILGEITTEEDFTGKSGQSTFARLAGYGFKRVGLVGLGKLEAAGSSLKVWKDLGENIATHSKTAQAHSVLTLIAQSKELSEDVKLAAASAITTGIVDLWCGAMNISDFAYILGFEIFQCNLCGESH